MSVVNTMELAPMRELSLDEIDAVSGGLTENQCIGAFTIGGGIVGGAAGFFAAGVGAVGGAGLGIGFGGGVGLFVCTYLAN